MLLFWNGKSADDKAVHAALKDVDRWDGRVTSIAPIKQISKYGRIARGVDVEQSPTLVVIDPELRAETLVGYVDATTIDQAVVDAFRNTTRLFTDAYLQSVDSVCAARRAVGEDPDARPATRNNAARAHDVRPRGPAFIGRFNAVKAPTKWRAFTHDRRRATSSAFARDPSLRRPRKPERQPRLPAPRNLPRRPRAPRQALQQAFDAQHLFSCGSQF